LAQGESFIAIIYMEMKTIGIEGRKKMKKIKLDQESKKNILENLLKRSPAS
jgi:hypothetical protein